MLYIFAQIFKYFGPFFAFYPAIDPENSNLKKMEKKTWRYYAFTHVYHKCRSFDVWFLRYKAQWTVFCHFGPFFPSDPPNNPKNQNFEKIKKYLKILSFNTFVPQMMITRCMVPEIRSATDRIFCHFGPFFVLLPH